MKRAFEAKINELQVIISNIQTQLDNISGAAPPELTNVSCISLSTSGNIHANGIIEIQYTGARVSSCVLVYGILVCIST
jgi:hypothetical protein